MDKVETIRFAFNLDNKQTHRDKKKLPLTTAHKISIWFQTLKLTKKNTCPQSTIKRVELVDDNNNK